MNGKTRMGIETPRLVDAFCTTISVTFKNINFAQTVYLKVDLLKNARFNQEFDVKGLDESVALGSRLMNAFYQHDLLREVRHDDALHPHHFHRPCRW
jgi:hypothetical protein